VETPTQQRCSFGPFILDPVEKVLLRNGQPVSLPPKALETLLALVERHGHVMEKAQLLNRVWPDTFVEEATLAQNVFTLRKVLGDSPDGHEYIETVPKRGYRFIAPVTVDGFSLATPAEVLAGLEPRFRARIRWRWWPWVAAATVVAVAVVLALWQPWRPRLAFQQRDWVLVAGFENRTGEPIFDGTLEYALGQELSNSRFVNVVPRERIADALSLMKKPAGTRIDASVGREICLRDGGIRALLVGRIQKLDTTYLLSATLVDPASGRALAGLNEQAFGQREVVAAIRRLANRVRERLGEELPLIQQSERQLEKVTTPSLRALQLYTQAMALVNESQWPDAAELLEQAIREDPDFASAHILLAQSYSNIPKDKEAFPHYQRAFELADTVPDRERYFITGSYYERFQGDRLLPDRKKATLGWEKAAQEYEILLRLYPDHYWATNNLCGLYSMRLGRLQDGAQCLVRLGELRPHDLLTNYGASWGLDVVVGDTARAEQYASRARQLASLDPSRSHPWETAWLEMLPAYESWLRGDVTNAQAAVNRVAQTIGSRTGEEADSFAVHVTGFYLTLGKLRAAEATLQSIRGADTRREQLALAAFARGDAPTLRKQLSGPWNGEGSPGPVLTILLARAGLSSEAAERSRSMPDPAFARLVRGELLLARGQPKEAILALQEDVEVLRPWAYGSFFLATESIARAWERQGDLERAVEVLEDGSKQRTAAAFYPVSPPLWMRNQVQLAQLYRKVGRVEDARKVEAELLKLLALADPDHPILLQLGSH
jgi:DNA-binding winged helix-turn-helix (wHTH) protein/tetratricopeptide (TPR) repeat protein